MTVIINKETAARAAASFRAMAALFSAAAKAHRDIAAEYDEVAQYESFNSLDRIPRLVIRAEKAALLAQESSVAARTVEGAQ